MSSSLFRWIRPALLGAVILTASPSDAGPPGVFVLGIDGVDPVVLQRLMDEGRMPNFARLAREGEFQSLGTSNPPQSPVAWSNFVTGMNPGGHGIYDFIHRDPGSYLPLSSAIPPPSGAEVTYITLFGYVVPMPWSGGDEVVNNRSGTPWWDVLDDAGVDVEVYRMPGNYPPTPSEALTLSGMGTTDVRGSPGTYTWYTDDTDVMLMDGLKADLYVVNIDDEDGDDRPDTVRTELKGPPDLLHLPPGKAPGESDYITAPLVIRVDPVADAIWIDVGEGRSETIIEAGEWSDWLEVDFGGMLEQSLNFTGIVRFYLKEVRPNLRLYASPVNINPGLPAQPVTTPDDGSEWMFEELGHFYTQGMPEETNALRDGLFDDDDYLAQVELVHQDGDAMLDLALRRFDRGDASFMYLSDIDLQSHMLWRHDDPKNPAAPRHPAFDPEHSPRYQGVIEGFYERVDKTLGDVRAALPEDALLIVMSDHGFQAQTRVLHLNDWLVQEGYLVLQEGKTSASVFDGIDWEATRAYGMGFNGVYLNLEGRERDGIVAPSEADALLSEISAKLEALTDPAQPGRRVVLHARKSTEVYSGERVAEAPDLVVGYDAGYGCSDASTLGEITGEPVLADNDEVGFTGNHLMAPEVVPGILLSNRKIPGDGHDLTDLTATLLDHYGLPPADGMVGTSIFK